MQALFCACLVEEICEITKQMLESCLILVIANAEGMEVASSDMESPLTLLQLVVNAWSHHLLSSQVDDPRNGLLRILKNHSHLPSMEM